MIIETEVQIFSAFWNNKFSNSNVLTCFVLFSYICILSPSYQSNCCMKYKGLLTKVCPKYNKWCHTEFNHILHHYAGPCSLQHWVNTYFELQCALPTDGQPLIG